MANQHVLVSDQTVSGSHDQQRTPDQEIAQIIDAPPVVVDQQLKGGTRLTRSWKHGEIHDFLPAMNQHVVMTYYGEVQPITLLSGGKRFNARTRKGTVTIIPQGHDGRWDLAGPIEVSHVYIPPQRLQECADQFAGGRPIELVDRVGFEDPTTMRILELLHREVNCDSQPNTLFVEQTLDLLCTQLIRAHSSVQSLQNASTPKGLSLRQVKEVTSYMRENLEHEITLDDLSGLLSISRFHFATAFRQATGMTPHEALVAQRMEAAKSLLTNRALEITQIALSVGYGTPSSFTAALRKANGVTPTVFRQNLPSPGAP
ncbi:AraC family transcriptional regulator [Bremerella alba]|uniref:HTH-type transcriptional activator RhaR n=1 Tax=Bremerella alba TaxID=980252 RepID=A0A7V9A9W3_9BACT|nr:AraC family transcriptional regulator [Bremerella alba]MBA2117862.1 HTH-type transcriptional activator RhaR [Bremerella alba]